MIKTKLFCFPHAGGTAMGYLKWKRNLNPSIELIPIELAGRGIRSSSKLYCSFGEAVTDIFNIIRQQLTDENFAFYGHSMGSLLAYELGQKLVEEKYPIPKHIFFSGREAPQIKKGKKYHDLPEKEFINEIIKMGGTSSLIFTNRDLYEFYMPILKADFKMHEGYIYQKKNKLNCDITIISGKEDPDVSSNDLKGWSDITCRKCSIYLVDGGHMFVNDNITEVTNIINKTIMSYDK